MPKERALVAIGIITLAIASTAVYELLTSNSQIQAKPEPIQIPDYSGELDSLKSQISSVNSQINSVHSQISSMGNNMSSLETLKNSITDVRAKLIDLQNKNSQVQQQPAPTTSQLVSVIDKSAYFPGDTVKIIAVGANPLQVVQVQLLDNSGYLVTSSKTYADSAGTVSYALPLSSSLLAGSYQIKLVSGQQTDTQPFTIKSLYTGQNSISNSYAFTAQTDKAIYGTGDLIQVSGTGYPGTSVTGVMTSLSGNTYSSATTVLSDGSYIMSFLTSGSYETGIYHVTLNNLGQTKTLSVYIESGSSSNSYTFTAQTDKSIYSRGDLIQVSGTGYPGTSVNGVLTSPSGNTYSLATTASSVGSYTMFFATSPSYEIGTWYITMTNLGQTKTLSLYMQPGNSNSYTFTAQTDRSVYTRGDLIQVSGIGYPSTSVNGVLTSPSGNTYSLATTASSVGSYSMLFATSPSYEIGTWYITMTNLGQTKTLTLYMQSGTSGSYTFTAQTDKSIYSRGDLIQVSGTGYPGTSVTGVLTSQSGNTYHVATTVQSDGSYTMFYQTLSSYETGRWNITLNHLSETKILYLFIQ